MPHARDSETPHTTAFLSHHATPSSPYALKAAAKSKPFMVTVEVRALSTKRTTSNRLGRRTRAVACFLCRIPLLLAFHMLNSIFGVVACMIVVTTAALSIGLMPACGFGVIIFQALVLATEKFAQLDIAIANLTTGIDGAGEGSDRLRVHPEIASEFTLRLDAREGRGNSEMPAPSSRSTASPQTLLAMVYFATVKLAVSILSFLIVAFVLSFPILVFLASGLPTIGLTISKSEFEEKPFAYVLTIVGIFALSLVLLVLFAVVSRELTDFVCGDPIAAAGDQPQRRGADSSEGSDRRRASIGLPLGCIGVDAVFSAVV